MKPYTSQEILDTEDLYELQDSYCSSGIPFVYQMTEGEIEWWKRIDGKYSIGDFIARNTSETFELTFSLDDDFSSYLYNDNGNFPKATMLSDETALQKLFFWLYSESMDYTNENGDLI